ncbi:Callose synthase [Cynara cardunculus var. scolymus]|uniref:Callose synthase n=1 Tax=Cynara cardunculus var. scolymus TaxID=59895 RepID=A0A118JUW5_CYNCS|nr:Callose synthase [Cynara cardunculus var. scolymus]
MDHSRARKHTLKVVIAAIWTIVLPIFYSKTRRKYTCYSSQYRSWLGEWCYSSYMLVVAFYLMSNAVNMILFSVPAIGRYIETSNSKISSILSWWTQPRLYVGRGMQESQFSLLKYLLNSFLDVYLVVFVGICREMCVMALFSVKNNAGAIAAIWAPVIMVSEKQMRNGLVKFVVVWNEIINCFREEDLISNREVELMKMPLSSELHSGVVYWPIFLLANKLPMALTVAKDFVGEDANLSKKIRRDVYMYIAIKECYDSLKYVLDILVVGDLDRRIIAGIVDEIEESIRKSTVLKDFDLSELLTLYAKCIDLVELLVEGNKEHHTKVVKVLQDVFEIVTSDMMKNGSRYSNGHTFKPRCTKAYIVFCNVPIHGYTSSSKSAQHAIFQELDEHGKEELRDWASFRGQTLSRTIRGMMYYQKALKLQAFLDMAEDDDILQGYAAIEGGNDTLSAQLDALADLKFTHVEIYRIKLPGSPNIGEGKPENQNHAIIFTRGEALQAIDMNQISVIGIYVFLYGQLYLVLSGLEKALLLEAKVHNIRSLETALASQSFIQLGLLTGLPMVMEIALEKGLLSALKDFVLMQLQLAAVFFTFSLGTKTHYFGRTILHGGAKYRPTGRKVVVFHASFTENYRLYSRSHFMKGFELLLLLIVHDIIRRSYRNHMMYVMITSAIWFLSLTWLFAPFLFNPSGFDWGKIVDDWKDWNKWIKQQGGIGIQQDKSWQSWWYDEQDHLRYSGWGSRIIEILLSLRFFIYQYGLVYHLDIAGSNKTVVVYVLSWVVIVVIFLLVKVVNLGRQYLSDNHQLSFRLFKASLFLSVIATIIALSYICQLSVSDLIVCCLAFLPTGWGLILVSEKLSRICEKMAEKLVLFDFLNPK